MWPNLVSGMVTAINVDTQKILENISVTLTPDGQTGFDIFHTLQGPIDMLVSPDEKWAATAVFSLTNVPRPPIDSADHVAIIDTTTDQVVAFVPTPAGTHGVNWGAKLGGGYYAYVTNEHAERAYSYRSRSEWGQQRSRCGSGRDSLAFESQQRRGGH